MLKLYGSLHSPNSRKVLWALEELGSVYTLEQLDLTKGDQRKPHYLALNPNARVPTLDDDGFIIWESNAILWYLADKHGKGALVPDDSHARGLVHQWTFWQASDWQPAIFKPWTMKLMASFGAPFDEKAHAHALEDVPRCLEIADNALKARGFIVGDALTIADIALGEAQTQIALAGIDVGGFANLRAYFARLGERPAFKKVHAAG